MKKTKPKKEKITTKFKNITGKKVEDDEKEIKKSFKVFKTQNKKEEKLCDAIDELFLEGDGFDI